MGKRQCMAFEHWLVINWKWQVNLRRSDWDLYNLLCGDYIYPFYTNAMTSWLDIWEIKFKEKSNSFTIFISRFVSGYMRRSRSIQPTYRIAASKLVWRAERGGGYSLIRFDIYHFKNGEQVTTILTKKSLGFQSLPYVWENGFLIKTMVYT